MKKAGGDIIKKVLVIQIALIMLFTYMPQITLNSSLMILMTQESQR